MQGGACKLCGAPIALGACEFDHSGAGEHRLLQVRGVRDLCELAAAAAAGLRAAEVERGRVCWGVDVVRCRKNGLANALSLASVLSFGFLTYVKLRKDGCVALLARLPYVQKSQAGVRPHAGGRRRDVAGLLVEPGCRRPRGPELPGLGAAQDGGGLARAAPGQAEGQCFDGAVYLMRTSQQPTVSPNFCGRGRPDALGPHLRDAALQEGIAPACVGLRDGGGVLRRGPDPPDAGGGSDALPQVPEDRLPGPAGFAQEVLAGGGGLTRLRTPRHAGLQVRAGQAAAVPPLSAGWERVEEAVAPC